MPLLRGGVVRYESGGGYWLELWKNNNKELAGLMPQAPTWWGTRAVAAADHCFILVRNWPSRVEQLGAFVEHVVRVDAQANFVALLAYKPRSPLTCDFVVTSCRRLECASAAELKQLRACLPDELSSYQELRSALDRQRTSLTARTLDFLERSLRLARLPQVIYALSPLFPTRALLSTILRRRQIAEFARTQPLALCFEWRRHALPQRLLLPLWGLSELAHWYDVMTWTRAHWSALEPACLHASNEAFETVRALCTEPTRRAEFSAAINLVLGLSRLWLATGMLPRQLTSEWHDATEASRRLALSCGGIALDGDNVVQVPSQQLLAATLAQQLDQHFGDERSLDEAPSSKRRRLNGQLEIYVAQFPDYALALRSVLARRASHGRCLLLSTTECGRLELAKHALQPILLSTLLGGGDGGGLANVVTCVVDQAHRLTLEDATQLLTLLMVAQRQRALDLLLVGDPEAPSKSDVLSTLWRQQRFRSVVWLEHELLVEPMFEAVRERASSMCAVRTALREDATLHSDVGVVHFEAGSAASLARALDRLLDGWSTAQAQIYCRRSEEAQLLSSALALTRGAAIERGRFRAGERVIIHDRGAVGILAATFETGRHVHVALEAPRPTAQLWSWMPTHVFTLGLIVSAAKLPTTEELSHEHCCGMPRLGRVTNHRVDSALVLLLRDCPQVAVPIVICFVGETTTRQDLAACAARCTERLFILTRDAATLEAALQRHSVAAISPPLNHFLDLAFSPPP